MNAFDLIASFGQAVTVTRQATAGDWVDGVYVPGPVITFDVVMSVQPISGKELVNLSEAQRTKRWVKGYCADELFTAEQSVAKKADLVAADGAIYEVQKVEAWKGYKSQIDPFWKVVMAEVNP